MQRWLKLTIIVLAADVVIVMAVAAAITWWGAYDVAADSGHSRPVAEFLHYAMERSVVRHAAGIQAPQLTDPVRILRGAAYFDIGCARCHGSPDKQPWAGAKEMLPSPPPLIGRIPRWRREELFWIVRHGVKMTAMPSWPVPGRDDEVWDMVAFLEQFASVGPTAARELVAGQTGDRAFHSGTESRTDPRLAEEIAACERCHGPDGRGGARDAFPAIAGMDSVEMQQRLLAYQNGDRPSGFMKTATQGLTEADLAALSVHFSGLQSDKPRQPELAVRAEPTDTTPDRHRGALEIAAAGCGSCHRIPGIPNADGDAGPPLSHLSGRIFLAGRVRNTPENLASFMREAQHFVSGGAMPDFRLSNRQAADIAAYLDGIQ